MGGEGVEDEIFQLGDVEEMLPDDGGGDAAQIEALAAAQDGGENFVGFSGGEDELYVGRGFLQGFEQGIKGRGGEHVDLIDVVDAEIPHRGGIADGFAEGADVVDAVVGGAVDFGDVEAAAFGDLDADGIVGVEIDLGAAGAVEGLGEDAGGGGFSRAAGAHEEVGVGEAVLGNGVAQGADHVVLAEHVVEGLGAVFSGEDLIGHARREAEGGQSARGRNGWKNGPDAGSAGRVPVVRAGRRGGARSGGVRRAPVAATARGCAGGRRRRAGLLGRGARGQRGRRAPS